jgi:mRNA-degrading endonuclease YafQ of YafQ-DinJ toxin-antitoxin module
MINKLDLENIVSEKLSRVLENKNVYQYASFDIALDNILLNQTLRFADPVTFNDPFDCNETLLQIVYNENQVEQIFNESSIQYSREFRRKFKKNLQSHLYQQDIIKPLKKDYKISCFSETYEEILMWSHYADKHNGICIGFKLPYRYKDDFIVSPVSYLNKLTPLDGETSVQRVLIYWLTSKSIRWEYEKEYRALRKAKTKEEFEYVKIEPHLIKEVIFGCNVSDLKIQETTKKLKESNLDFDSLLIKQMKIDKSNFLLKEKIIKPSA